MTETNSDHSNINRRNAMKALAAAAGAAGIAALPTRWSKPGVMVGAVPAHAQASQCGPLTFSPENLDIVVCGAGSFTPDNFYALVTPATGNIPLNVSVELTGTAAITLGNPAGTYYTNGAGFAYLSVGFSYNLPSSGDVITLVWTFANPADGCDEYRTEIRCVIIDL